MIENDAQLQQAIEQIENLYHALDALRADILQKNPRNFALFAEGPLDEIRKLQSDIEAYVNRLESATSA
jgi:HAMP domain-containing protein